MRNRRTDTPRLRYFARHLLALEGAAARTAEESGSAAVRVAEKLRPPLVLLAGQGGFRSLLSRALAHSNDEVRWLKAVHVNADGSLGGFEDSVKELSPDELSRGEVIVIARFAGLLVNLIGEAVTVRLLEQAWPGISTLDLKSETEE